jgi:hypothetical protein
MDAIFFRFVAELITPGYQRYFFYEYMFII